MTRTNTGPATAAAAFATAWVLIANCATTAGCAAAPVTQLTVSAQRADYFQFPLPTWKQHCLGFGSQWKLCDGTVLRSCAATHAVWLHTGVDIRTGVQPVRAAANGVIVGYTVDPTFKGGVLIRHQTAHGIVLTQYWHVWPRPGFRPGKVVSRGQVFADVASMGSRTHLHFAVFRGDVQANAWRGALPPSPCDGFPAFPNHFVNPTAFIKAHLAPATSNPNPSTPLPSSTSSPPAPTRQTSQCGHS
ncbi:MAG TPA: M23 family metallopeptidase [Candidatus Dormibacteraeota bacterium]|jgi:murein DD-endopeptidase MepM/ murein hydrolase activator NlpD